jgi:hypothetical protein
MAHQSVLPQLIPGGSWSEMLLAQGFNQRPLEGIELTGPQHRGDPRWDHP